MKHFILPFILFFSVLLNAQVTTELNFNTQSIEYASNNIEHFKDYISKHKKSLKLTTSFSKKVPKVFYKEGLDIYLVATLKKDNGKHIYTSKPIKKTIFPGDLFFPGNIFFPEDLFTKLDKGNYEIDFQIKPTNPEFTGVLRKKPARVPLTFEIK